MNTSLRVLYFLALSALAGCSMGFPGDREDCEGYPYVANDVVPDTVTVQVGGPKFEFDLAEGPVFKHSAGKPLLDYRVGVREESVAGVFNSRTIVAVYPRSAGVTLAGAGAYDDCDKSSGVRFIVKVIGPP